MESPKCIPFKLKVIASTLNVKQFLRNYALLKFCCNLNYSTPPSPSPSSCNPAANHACMPPSSFQAYYFETFKEDEEANKECHLNANLDLKPTFFRCYNSFTLGIAYHITEIPSRFSIT